MRSHGSKIKGKRVELRPVTIEDSEKIIGWRNSDSVRKFFILQETFTLDSQKRWMEEVVARGKAVQFLIVSLMTGEEIGTVYLRDLNRIHRKGEFGIFIGDDTFRGQGYGTEAARLIIAYGFEKLELHKIYLKVLSENERAIASYEKVGFQREAVLRDEVCINDVFHDIVRMAVFPDEVRDE